MWLIIKMITTLFNELELERGEYFMASCWYEPSLRDDFYDPYYYDDHTYDDYVHVDDLPDLDHARDHMKTVLEALYGEGNLDDLESSLEEVLSILEMKMPTGTIRVLKGGL